MTRFEPMNPEVTGFEAPYAAIILWLSHNLVEASFDPYSDTYH